MTETYSGAIGQMARMLKTAWDAGLPAIVGYVPEIRWPYDEKRELPPLDKYWARFSYTTVRDVPATHRDGSAGKRYLIEGILFVQLFAPMSDALAGKRMEQIIPLVRNIWLVQSDITFRNVRPNELQQQDKWYRANIVAEFEYFEVRQN